MSTLKANNIQIGQSATATQNFVLSVPASPDGTIKLARGNQGATTQDVIAVNSSGIVSFPQGSPQTAKAWINFDGTGTATTGISATWSQSGTTVTVTTSSAHGLIVGQQFYSTAPQTGFFTVLAVTSTTVFTYTTTTTSTNSGSSTIYKNFIRSSYNVSSITKNGTGDYTVNFTTALADTNYTMAQSVNYDGTGPTAMGAAMASRSTTSVRVYISWYNSAKYDCQDTSLIFFGN